MKPEVENLFELERALRSAASSYAADKSTATCKELRLAAVR